MQPNILRFFLWVFLGLMLSTNSRAAGLPEWPNLEGVSHGGANTRAVYRPWVGVTIGMKFGERHKTEWLLNGLPLVTPASRSNMTCPQEGSCAGMLTVFGIAAVVSVVLLSNISKSGKQ